MNLREIQDNLEDQQRGADCHILSPHGTPTGIIFRVVGPDSRLAKNTELQFFDELAEAADTAGRVDARTRDKLMVDRLARLVLDMTADEEPGKRITVSHAAIVKFLQVNWIRAQVDDFAGDRSKFKPGGK